MAAWQARGGAVHVATTKRVYKGKTYVTHLLRRSLRNGKTVTHETLGKGAIAPVPKILRDFWPFLCSNPAEFDSQKTLLCKYV